MRRILAILMLLCGCSESASDIARETRKGELRISLFTRCMDLAAKMPRQTDDDVSDVVNSCSWRARDMSNYIQ